MRDALLCGMFDCRESTDDSGVDMRAKNTIIKDDLRVTLFYCIEDSKIENSGPDFCPKNRGPKTAFRTRFSKSPLF